jgi:hypothetical protein
MNSLSVGIIYASTIVGFTPGGTSIGGGLVSTANLVNLVSTSYLATQIGSTVTGLGTAGYLSSTQFNIIQVNTLSSGRVLASSITVQETLFAKTVSSVTVQAPSIGVVGVTTFYGDGSYLQNLTAANVVGTLPFTAYGSQTIPLGSINPLGNLTITGNINAANLAGLVSTPYLDNKLGSTVIGLGTAGYLSSIPSLGGFVSTANLANLVSTTYLNMSLTSTVIGLGTAGYISSSQFLSTTFGYSRAFRTLSANISTLFFSSATGNTAYISSLTIDQLTFGDGNGWADFGAIRAAVVSSYQVNTGILYAPIISTSLLVGVNFLTQVNLTSTVIGLGTTGYLSSAITNLGGFGLVSTANLVNLVSTANLARLVSTANLATLVSTSYLQTQLGSTVIGLGTVGYLSTQISSFLTLSTGNLITSSITFNSPSSAPVGNNVFVSSSLFFFNQFVIGGTRVQQPQIFTF